MKYNHQVATTLQTDNNNFEKKIKKTLVQDQIAQHILDNLNNEKFQNASRRMDFNNVRFYKQVIKI